MRRIRNDSIVVLYIRAGLSYLPTELNCQGEIKKEKIF